MFNKQFWITVFTLTGTIIGAGILGLPYVFAQSGFFIGIIWLFFLGIIVLYVFLCLGEISLRTKSFHQLPGLAEIYLGKKGKYVMLISFFFGAYTALLAYLVGESESLSFIFTGNTQYSFLFAFGFWVCMTMLLREGLRGLKQVEFLGVLGVIIIILTIFFTYISSVNYFYLTTVNLSLWYLPFGIVFFALLGFSSIPELTLQIKGSEKLFFKAIIIGVSIPIILYTIFCFIFIGVLGEEVPVIATLGFGPIVSLLGVFTMTTSYFVLSFALNDVYKYDLGFSKPLQFFLVSLFPFGLYTILYKLDSLNFIKLLGIGGVISGGLTGILILLMNKSAKKRGKRKPEYSMWINWLVIILLSLFFIAGVVFELVI